MRISAIVKCQLLDNELLEMTKESVATIRPYVQELILVDQASVVGLEWLKTTADVYIHNEVSKGFPWFAKHGIERATGDYVAVLNNDIKFQGDWVTPLVKLFKETNVGLVHPKMLDWEDTYSQGKEVIYNPPPQSGMYFSAFMIDPNIYNLIGGWNEEYDFWGYDDWDFYYRLLKSGHNAVWTDKVCYWHKGGATISKIGREQFIQKNKDLFIKLHGINPHSIDWNFL